MVIVVLDVAGKLLAPAAIRTEAATILALIRGQAVILYVILEQSASSAWPYDLLSPQVAQLAAGASGWNSRASRGRGARAELLDRQLDALMPLRTLCSQ